jgi:hypothetical protein
MTVLGVLVAPPTMLAVPPHRSRRAALVHEYTRG